MKPLPQAPQTTETPSSPLLRWRAHSKCLNESSVFSPAPSTIDSIAKLSCNLKINSFHPATKWLSMGSRLDALGLTKIPVSKWKWEEVDHLEIDEEKQKKRPTNEGLLKKRDSDNLVKNRERGFNLDLFDLVKTNYELTHPSLMKVQKAKKREAKSSFLKINPNGLDTRLKGIQQWLEQFTQNNNYDTFGIQMMKYLQRSTNKKLFIKAPQLNDESVMIAGNSKDYRIPYKCVTFISPNYLCL
jgi:hypothetical protein